MATISSHALNGADGTHAGGIRATLVNLTSGEKLFDIEFDDGGRLLQQIEPQTVQADHRYELTFHTAEYWKKKGFNADQIIEEIVLRFSMPDKMARYHMPVILAPKSYSTWASLPEV